MSENPEWGIIYNCNECDKITVGDGPARRKCPQCGYREPSRFRKK